MRCPSGEIMRLPGGGTYRKDCSPPGTRVSHSRFTLASRGRIIPSNTTEIQGEVAAKALANYSSERPEQPVHLLFLHHSVGEHLLSDVGPKMVRACSSQRWRSAQDPRGQSLIGCMTQLRVETGGTYGPIRTGCPSSGTTCRRSCVPPGKNQVSARRRGQPGRAVQELLSEQLLRKFGH